MIQLTIHPAKFTSKPIGKEVGSISNGIAQYKCTIGSKQFLKALENGQTWSALFANKRNIDNWLGQQLFAADIDKDNKSLAELEALCELHCVEPFVIHESFSSSKAYRKWRVIFKTSELIDDICLATGIQRKLSELFGGDSAVTDVARLFYGTNKPIAYFDEDAVLDIDELGELELLQHNYKQSGSMKVVEPVTEDFISDQFDVFTILNRQDPGRLSLIKTRLEEAHYCITNIGEGSGYQSVWHSARRLAQLKELIAPYIEYFVADCVHNCKDYEQGVWQHRPKLDKIIAQGIMYGRNRLYG